MTKLLSVLVLDYAKQEITRRCLQSIRDHVKVPYDLVYLDNGSAMDYPWDLYRDGLCDVLISKREGCGGGYGQTDLLRYCSTQYALFVQNDQEMMMDLDQGIFDQISGLLRGDYRCVDLNGDQSARGVWTDRAHLIDTTFFASLAPFPNGGPGHDAVPWNEAYLQQRFIEGAHKIAHVKPVMFADRGVWSVRQAGDGIFKHRCDTKQMWVIKTPTYRTDVYPPLSEAEWVTVLKGEWVEGAIPAQWQAHSFKHWGEEAL